MRIGTRITIATALSVTLTLAIYAWFEAQERGRVRREAVEAEARSTAMGGPVPRSLRRAGRHGSEGRPAYAYLTNSLIVSMPSVAALAMGATLLFAYFFPINSSVGLSRHA